MYLEDGRSVSEELARAGLGIPIAVGANRSHLAAVKSAQSEAMENAFGFYDPAQNCTVPSRYQTALAGLSSATATTPATSGTATERSWPLEQLWSLPERLLQPSKLPGGRSPGLSFRKKGCEEWPGS